MPSASIVPPSSPRLPNAASSPIPATAGGRTSGSSTSVTDERAPAEARASRADRRPAFRRAHARVRDRVRLQRHDERVARASLRARRAAVRARRRGRCATTGARGTPGSAVMRREERSESGRPHGRPKPAARSSRCAARRPQERDHERCAASALGSAHDRDRVARPPLGPRRGSRSHDDVGRRPRAVGRVDEPGVGLPERDLASIALHVLLLAHDLASTSSLPEPLAAPHACTRRPARRAPPTTRLNVLRGGGRRRRGCPRGSRGHDEHQPVRREDDRPLDDPFLEQLLRIPRARRREDVRGRALRGSGSRAGPSRRSCSARPAPMRGTPRSATTAARP